MKIDKNGVFFTITSHHASRIELCLFDEHDNEQRIAMKQDGVHFSTTVPKLKTGARYGFRAHGPWAPERGHRFDSSKLLVDPNATRLDRPYTYHPDLARRGVDTARLVPKAIVEPPVHVARAKVRQPSWIYELPVKAFSQLNAAIPEHLRGTISALAEPAALAHFKRIGADTIELMPLMAWIDERHLHAAGLRNAWGYNPVTFMAPEPRLAPGGFAEIAETIRVLSSHGMQVILDVVLNHTGESDADGPTLSFRGLDAATWYSHSDGRLSNDTGCGNTVNLNHPTVVEHVVAALRHWVLCTGIAGFRFDLATIMGRLPNGFDAHAPLIASIAADPVLRDCILIAEPWDVGPGGYQLGNFPKTWHEWNDRYRDDVRRFWRGDEFSGNALATRLAGSSDVFSRKSPSRSINFLSAHDGFALRDLTLFHFKSNLANGENNRDGKSDEVTVVGGDVNALLATLFFSRGTPMLTAGDEFGRTQNGNNNAYAQDNETTWLNWANADQELIDFTAALVALRMSEPSLHGEEFLSDEVKWFAAGGNSVDWSRPDNSVLGLRNGDAALIINRSNENVLFPLAARKGFAWRRLFASRDGTVCPAQSVCLFRESKA